MHLEYSLEHSKIVSTLLVVTDDLREKEGKIREVERKCIQGNHECIHCLKNIQILSFLVDVNSRLMGKRKNRNAFYLASASQEEPISPLQRQVIAKTMRQLYSIIGEHFYIG